MIFFMRNPMFSRSSQKKHQINSDSYADMHTKKCTSYLSIFWLITDDSPNVQFIAKSELVNRKKELKYIER